MIEPLTCKEVAELLTEYLERKIPWNQRLLTRLHLRLCPGCQHLLDELMSLPRLFERFDQLDTEELRPIGEAALANVIGHLNDSRRPRFLPESPVPQTAQRMLSSFADLPLRLLAMTHSAMMQGTAPKTEPFLPEEVLELLPSPKQWKWKHFPGGIRKALLWAQGGGPSLSLVFMPPNFSLASHTHIGSESLLVLEGELEHEDRCLTNGDWIHMESGSSHSPYAFNHGCWCLVRDEGTVHFTGPLGWAKGMVAGA
jgi:hypothetical protein